MCAMQQRGQIAVHQITDKELIESEGEALVYGEFAYPFSDLLRTQGMHTPILHGPNSGYGRILRAEKLAAFYLELSTRRTLMAQGRYPALFWRKLLREGHKMAQRYLRWFINRVLRLKVLTGQDRSLCRDELKTKFR